MNFTRASQELHITQPAVSQHIRFLEQLYQTSLFLREGKHIRLTPAGEILLATMTQLRNDERAMMARMRVCAGEKRTLRFGVTLTIGEYIIASIFFPAQIDVAFPILVAIGNLVDPPATMINSAGDYVVCYIVSRFNDGKDWLDRAIAKKTSAGK